MLSFYRLAAFERRLSRLNTSRNLLVLRAFAVGTCHDQGQAKNQQRGDDDFDQLLPFDEPYHIPATTAKAVEIARQHGGRVIAVGTSVVRALEDAATADGHLRSGDGMARGKIGPTTHLRVVDAILSGTHEPGTSHYELLRAFLEDSTLERATEELTTHGYKTHEFGDSVLILSIL